jgi:hypothetical protein
LGEMMPDWWGWKRYENNEEKQWTLIA